MCEAKRIRPINKYLSKHSNTSFVHFVLGLDCFQKVQESLMRHRVQQPIIPASENGRFDKPLWVLGRSDLDLLWWTIGLFLCRSVLGCHQYRASMSGASRSCLKRLATTFQAWNWKHQLLPSFEWFGLSCVVFRCVQYGSRHSHFVTSQSFETAFETPNGIDPHRSAVEPMRSLCGAFKAKLFELALATAGNWQLATARCPGDGNAPGAGNTHCAPRYAPRSHCANLCESVRCFFDQGFDMIWLEIAELPSVDVRRTL